MADTNTILVTGGGSGIGLALAERFVRQGHRVIACGRRENALAQARERVPGLVTHTCDIANAESRADLVRWLAAEHPALDILVNNAGIQQRHDFTRKIDPARIAAEIEINLTAPILLTAALIPTLRAGPRGTIMNVSSALAFCPLAVVPVYCATKAAMHSFTLSLRHQLGAAGLRVIEVAPPMVDTELGERDADAPRPPMIMSVEDFADGVMAQLAAGADEILVGPAAATRAKGEALFPVFNR
jgi:uncharacterized oxidoreductase